MSTDDGPKALKAIGTWRCWGGSVVRFEHASSATGTMMRLTVFLPPGAGDDLLVPALYVLSGLTCTDDNFMHKSGAQRAAAEAGIALIAMDTSPRGASVPGEDLSYDLGTGAGWYMDATQSPWSPSYRMYQYVMEEVPLLLERSLPLLPNRRSVMGHSMGGHGALICALKNPNAFQSVSAFAPVCHPSSCSWGQKALGAYLGDDRDAWKEWDATELILAGATTRAPILIDVGTDDEFLLGDDQLLIGDLESAISALTTSSSLLVNVRRQVGYDHSYYTIATFIDDHIKFHSERLSSSP